MNQGPHTYNIQTFATQVPTPLVVRPNENWFPNNYFRYLNPNFPIIIYSSIISPNFEFYLKFRRISYTEVNLYTLLRNWGRQIEWLLCLLDSKEKFLHRSPEKSLSALVLSMANHYLQSMNHTTTHKNTITLKSSYWQSKNSEQWMW